jgi:tellurite resistance protein TerB
MLLKTRAPAWNDFIREFRETHAQTLLEPIVAACAMVAYADGWVAPEEEKRMAALIGDFRPIEVFGTDEVLRAFNEISRRFEDDHDAGEREALALVAELRTRPRHARVLMQTCCAIATADGALDGEERHAALRLCGALGLDPEEFDLAEAR